MSTYSIDELIARWKKEDMTAEQMIGQLLLLIQQIDLRLRELRRAQGLDAAPTSDVRR